MKTTANARKARFLPESFMGEIDSISDTCLILCNHLSFRGLGTDRIYQLVSDFIRTVESSYVFDLCTINHELESMGWPAQILDQTAFELIREILYSVFEYQVEVHTVH